MKVSYEWDVETVQDGEVIDHNHADRLRDLPWLLNPGEVLVLVRTEEGGERSWAYVDETRMLPARFSVLHADGEYRPTGVSVPKTFHREIARIACGRK